MTLKVGIVSLGCVKNLVDTELMLGYLKQAGFTITNREAEADIIIVNTCGFITDSKEESINTVLEMAQLKESGRCRALLVAGCLSQRYSSELMEEMPEVDGVFGVGMVPHVVAIVNRVLDGEKVLEVGAPEFEYGEGLPRVLSTPAHTAYVKIAEGCDNRCAYCAIPDIRGGYRSRTLEAIERETAALVAGGAKEIILIAQDTTRYGLDLYGEYTLAELAKRLVKIDGLAWLRLLYCYPTRLTQELIDVMASEKKICRYIDLPLQHASDAVLARMNRGGAKAQVKHLIENLRQAIPGLVLRTSFIVGFPGETEEDFQELLEFMQTIKFDRVGIFTYSPEEGTPAVGLENQVPEEVKQERYKRAMLLQQKVSLARNKDRIGKNISVLIEGRAPDKKETYIGRSEFDAPEIDGKVIVKSYKKLEVGDIVSVYIDKAYEYDLIGELI